jgi:hypothetical protein
MHLYFFINMSLISPELSHTQSDPGAVAGAASDILTGPLLEHMRQVIAHTQPPAKAAATKSLRHTSLSHITLKSISVSNFSKEQDFISDTELLQSGKASNIAYLDHLTETLKQDKDIKLDKKHILTDQFLLVDNLTDKAGEVWKKTTALQHKIALASADLAAITSKTPTLKSTAVVDPYKLSLFYQKIQRLGENDDCHVIVYDQESVLHGLTAAMNNHGLLMALPQNVSLQFFSYQPRLYVKNSDARITPYSSPSKGSGGYLAKNCLRKNKLFHGVASLKHETLTQITLALISYHKAHSTRMKKGYQKISHDTMASKINSQTRQRYSCADSESRKHLGKAPVFSLYLFLNFDNEMGQQHLYVNRDGEYKISGPLVMHLLELIRTAKPLKVILCSNSRSQCFEDEFKASAKRLVFSWQAFELLALTLRNSLHDDSIQVQVDPFLLADTYHSTDDEPIWQQGLRYIGQDDSPEFAAIEQQLLEQSGKLQSPPKIHSAKIDLLYCHLQQAQPAPGSIVVIYDADQHVVTEQADFFSQHVNLLPSKIQLHVFHFNKFNSTTFITKHVASIQSQENAEALLENAQLNRILNYRHQKISITKQPSFRKFVQTQLSGSTKTHLDSEAATHRAAFNPSPVSLANYQAVFRAFNDYQSKMYSAEQIKHFTISRKLTKRQHGRLYEFKLQKEPIELIIYLDYDGCFSPENITLYEDDTMSIYGPLIDHIRSQIYHFDTRADSNTQKYIVTFGSISNRQSFEIDNKNSGNCPGSPSSLLIFQYLVDIFLQECEAKNITLTLDTYLLNDTFRRASDGATWEQTINYIYDESTAHFPIRYSDQLKIHPDSLLSTYIDVNEHKLDLAYCRLQRLSSEHGMHVIIYDDREDILTPLYDTYGAPEHSHLIPNNVSCQFFHYTMQENSKTGETLITGFPADKSRPQTIRGTGNHDRRRVGLHRECCERHQRNYSVDDAMGRPSFLPITIENLLTFHERNGGNDRTAHAKAWPSDAQVLASQTLTIIPQQSTHLFPVPKGQVAELINLKATNIQPAKM